MNQNFPFNDPNANPLPDANQIDRQTPRPYPVAPSQRGPTASADRRQLRKLFLILLGIGLGLGLLTALGVSLVMARLDLIGVPGHQPQFPAR